MVFDSKNNETRRFNYDLDWNPNRHKLILFFPETFTPVCETEMGALNKWVEEFDKLDVDVYGATTDPSGAVQEWYNEDEVLKNSNYKVLSSYILPQRLGIINGGKTKRASVFIARNNDVVIQEHFLKVGRSIAELHRQMYAYVQDSYCGEGWKDPSDGFLNDDSKKE